jgi:hypothetical protein
MNLAFEHLLPAEFDPGSKVWIYQAERLFTLQEVLEIELLVENFTANWKSHGTPVVGFGTVFFGQFIILMADETATGVSGCSTDSSVRLIKEIEQRFKVNLFNRQLLAFVVKEKIELLPLSQLSYAVDNGFINKDTLYFNNTILTKTDLLNNWLVPAEKSWLKNKLFSPLVK